MFSFFKKVFRLNLIPDNILSNWEKDRDETQFQLPHFNQRDIPACTAHSFVTMMQMEYYRQTRKMINFSPRFLDILSWTPDLDLNDGRDIKIVMAVMNKIGCCTEDLLPNDTTLPVEEYRNRNVITEAMLIEASKYRGSDIGFIPTTIEEADKIIYQSLGELKDYYIEIGEMRKKFPDNTLEVRSKKESHILNNDLLSETFSFFDKSKEIYDESPYVIENKLRNELNIKYKEFIRQDLFAKGVAARIDGFAFIVYSDDHDKHFHVIHRGRGVDARFLFPEMELLNYKNTRNFISSKEEKKFKEFLSQPDIFQKLKAEFGKRE